MASPAGLDEVQSSRAPAAERRAERSASARASTLRRLATVWLLGLAVLFTVGMQTQVPVEDLLLDASVVGGGHWYSGLITSIGVVIWTVAATALFGAGYLTRLGNRPQASRMLVLAGTLTAALLFDDLLMLHSDLLPRLTGLSKMVIVGCEGVATGAWVLRWRAEISRTRWELLVASAFGFAGSVITDATLAGGSDLNLLVEDGAKFLGVLALCAWSISTASDLVKSLSVAA